jgi:quercetin dioxygenase-like cupin family protein
VLTVRVDLSQLAAEGAGSGATGALWRLQGDRQLDVNLVRLPPGEHIPGYVEPSLDVLLVVVAGAGSVALGEEAREEAQDVSPGILAWLPRGAHRSVRAGPDGLVYLTAHRRRPGLSIASGPPG